MTRNIITVEELQEMLGARQPVTVLDVRPAGEPPQGDPTGFEAGANRCAAG